LASQFLSGFRGVAKSAIEEMSRSGNSHTADGATNPVRDVLQASDREDDMRG
jgi:hypothetical protein